MHIVLGISELQRDIFLHLIAENAQGTLANLAQACRAFQENALDLLWEYQADLLPLVQCVSGALVENIEYDGGITIRVIVSSPLATEKFSR